MACMAASMYGMQTVIPTTSFGIEHGRERVSLSVSKTAASYIC